MVRFTIRPPFSRYKVVENQKIGNASNELQHLTVQFTLYTPRNYPPEAQISYRFVLPVVFELQSCRKSEMHRMTSKLPHT